MEKENGQATDISGKKQHFCFISDLRKNAPLIIEYKNGYWFKIAKNIFLLF